MRCSLDQEAVVAVASHDRAARLAALDYLVRCFEDQVSFGRRFVMARQATALEDR